MVRVRPPLAVALVGCQVWGPFRGRGGGCRGWVGRVLGVSMVYVLVVGVLWGLGDWGAGGGAPSGLGVDSGGLSA